MSDPSKPLPLTQKVLDSLAPWKEDDDYCPKLNQEYQESSTSLLTCENPKGDPQ